MGKLIYDNTGDPIEMDEYMLAHVKAVMLTKLRRGESFSLSWKASGGGRRTVWLHPAVPVRFEFDEDERPVLDQALIRRLTDSANGYGGLQLLEDAIDA